VVDGGHALNLETDPANPEVALSPASPPPEPRTPSTTDKIFVGSDGIRAGWRLLIYVAMIIVFGLLVISALRLLPVAHRVGKELRAGVISVAGILFQEVPQFLVVILPAGVMTFIEKRRLGRYGLPLQSAFGLRFWQGAAWGFLQMTVLLEVMHFLGAFSFGTIALHGAAIAKYALLYAVGFLFVGLSEEFLFRGYIQYTLSRGIGFWPAAVITSLLFAAAHVQNQGEAKMGILMVAVDGMFSCFILWRTGNLWWAVGNHAAWDFTQSFIYGVPDSGQNITNHLMNPSFHGPDWLTGGPVGPEGSLLIPALFALSIVAFHFCYRKREYSDPA